MTPLVPQSVHLPRSVNETEIESKWRTGVDRFPLARDQLYGRIDDVALALRIPLMISVKIRRIDVMDRYLRVISLTIYDKMLIVLSIVRALTDLTGIY